MFKQLKHLISGGASTAEPKPEAVVLPATLHSLPGRELGSGINLDQRLVESYFRHKFGTEAVPLATESFLKKSRAEYCERWCVRELVQNFVDANPHHPETINGVQLLQFEIDGGSYETLITGNWSFKDHTGLTALHSEKASATSAGGNAIGLKQVAIRLLRDFQVDEFEIVGEGWALNYHLIDRNQVNAYLGGLGVEDQVQHNWLVAEIKTSTNSGACSYRIRTKDNNLHQALSEFYEVGVCEQNPFLKNASFSGDKGQIVWGSAEDRRSRLFINGQVFAYSFKGSPETSDYWNGPGHVTLRLNGVKYQMSVDRPPLTVFTLDTYCRDLLTSMSVPQLVLQLKESQQFWTNHTELEAQDYQKKPYCIRLVQKIVEELHNRVLIGKTGAVEYSPKDDFEKEFGKNLLADHTSLSSTQRFEIQQQGYTICPEFFSKIGMVSAASILEEVEVLTFNRPKDPSAAFRTLAEEHGVPVSAKKFQDTAPQSVVDWFLSQVDRDKFDVLRTADTQIRISFPGFSASEAILRHPLPTPRSSEQKLIHAVRSFVSAGLSDGWLESAYAILASHVVTFKNSWDSITEEEQLLIRLSKTSAARDCCLVIDADVESCTEILRCFETTQQKEIKQSSGAESQFSEEDALKMQARPIDHGENQLESAEPQEVAGVPVEGAAERNAERAAAMEKIEASLETELAEVQAIAKVSTDSPKAFDINVVKQYLAGLDKGGVLSASPESGYLRGATISDLLTEFCTAEISVIKNEEEPDLQAASPSGQLAGMLKALAPEDTHIDHFEVIMEPSSRQLLCLHILREYAALACGVRIPNDLFVYQGSGSKGINVGQKAIGMHAALCEVKFEEAYSIFVHEVAHNFSMKHDHAFIMAVQTLLAKSEATLFLLANKLQREQELSAEELRLLAIRQEWSD